MFEPEAGLAVFFIGLLTLVLCIILGIFIKGTAAMIIGGIFGVIILLCIVYFILFWLNDM